jgi:hypothetical protein
MHDKNIGLSWDLAIAQALKGRPDLFAWMVANCAPDEHRDAVARLILNPPKPAGRPQKVPEDFCKFLRAVHADLVRDYEKRFARPVDEAYRTLAQRYPYSVGRLRDIVERKKAYRDNGELPPIALPKRGRKRAR